MQIADTVQSAIVTAISTIAAIEAETQSALERPRQVMDTPEFEAELYDLDRRGMDAVRKLGAIQGAGLPDLFAKIRELARWRAQSPDAFCFVLALDALVDGIIADADRLDSVHRRDGS